jgi:hypothetical protein
MTNTLIEDSNKVMKLNDLLRTTFQSGKVVLTEGIQALPLHIRGDLLKKVREFNEFTEENDPYQEHDFGQVSVGEIKVFWKIDYYDLSMKYHSPDKEDPEVTVRVLTIMLTGEY